MVKGKHVLAFFSVVLVLFLLVVACKSSGDSTTYYPQDTSHGYYDSHHHYHYYPQYDKGSKRYVAPNKPKSGGGFSKPRSGSSSRRR